MARKELNVSLPDDHVWLRLQPALTRFLSSRNRDPEELASESVFRVLENIANGVQIRNIEAFAYSIAKNVLKEDRRRRRKMQQLVQLSTTTVSVNSDERQNRCLEHCLKKCLKRSERKLLEEYYLHDGEERIVHRKKMAAKHHLTVEQLRIAVFRLRERVQECVQGLDDQHKYASNESDELL